MSIPLGAPLFTLLDLLKSDFIAIPHYQTKYPALWTAPADRNQP
jgi:hypothetical protein